MKRKKKEKDDKNLRVAFFFGLFVFSLIVISLAIRLVFLVLQSGFDGQHRFNIAVMPANLAQEKNFTIVSFAPDTNSILLLNVSSIGTSDGSSSDLNVQKYLKIPIDATVKLPQTDVNLLTEGSKKGSGLLLANKNISAGLETIFFRTGGVKTRMTVIDMLRLWFFTKGVPSYAVESKNLSISLNEADFINDLAADKVLSQYFTDSTILEEKVSIQIVNGTGTLGLGSKLARLITNMGANVVAVSTADEPIAVSEISYFGKKTYTLNKLSKILDLKTVETKKQTISDIVINLGKDSLTLEKF